MSRNIIIPLGGLGNRFQEAHYTFPKPLIKVYGKPIIEWVIDSINLEDINHIIIPYHRNLFNYNFESILKKKYPNINFFFYCLGQNTKGAADTIYQVLLEYKKISNGNINLPIISLDGDNFYTCDILKLWHGQNQVFAFKDYQESPIYSYVKIKNDNKTVMNNKLVDIKEKVKISNLACTGAYAFCSGKTLMEYCCKVITNNNVQKGELYISSVIKSMLNDELIFNIKTINDNNYKCLGTPIQVRLFVENNTDLIPKKRYCFDLDNTLVTYPKVSCDYTTVEPLQKNINLVRQLYNTGNIIIIHTARRMKTMDGNQGKVLASIGKITFDTLEKFDIPYHEIYFGKPLADFYIDDLGVNVFENLEKAIGYYNDTIECRSFHSVGINSLNVYQKEGIDLSGEIYFYQNIPSKYRNYFPRLINFDKLNNKWYTMEKIDGVVFSNMYINKELHLNHLDKLLKQLNALHHHPIQISNNYQSEEYKKIKNLMYSNYLEKMEKRYVEHDYSIYPNSSELYQYLKNELTNYQNKNKGILGIIHGDPVFTNIMLDKYNSIKMIDIRGKLGDELSIYGDIFYDYAKIYQSLIGYDEILKEQSLTDDYKVLFINYFESYIIETYNKDIIDFIKILTKSLLFSLLPLHDNNQKCMMYYQLINTF